MALIHTVRRLLRKEFPGAVLKLETSSETEGRVEGTFVWEGFDGQMQIDRQVRLHGILAELPKHEQLKVSLILTLTPEELSSMSIP